MTSSTPAPDVYHSSINPTIEETSIVTSRTSSHGISNPQSNNRSDKWPFMSITSIGSESSDEESLADYERSNDQSNNRSSEWNCVSRDGSSHHSLPQSTNHISDSSHNNSFHSSRTSIQRPVDQSIIRQRARYQLDHPVNQLVDQNDHCSCGDVPLKELLSLIRLRPNYRSIDHLSDQSVVPWRRSSISQSINQSNDQPVSDMTRSIAQQLPSPSNTLSTNQCNRGCCSMDKALHSLRSNLRSINHSNNQSINQSPGQMHLADVCFNVSGVTITQKDLSAYQSINQTNNQSIDLLDGLDVEQTDSNNQSNNQLLFAHRVILAARSTVFEQMFHDRWNQSIDQTINPTINRSIHPSIMVIDIPDITPVAFSALLDYIYEDALPDSHSSSHSVNQSINQSVPAIHLPSLLYAAMKYDLPRLIGSTNQALINLSINQSLHQSINLWRSLRSINQHQLADQFKQFTMTHATMIFQISSSINQSINQSIEVNGHMKMTPAIEQAIDQSLQFTIQQANKQSNSQSNNSSNTHLIKQSIKQSNKQSINHSLNQFELIPFDCLIELISDDHMVVTEVFLFDCLMRWSLVRDRLNQSLSTSDQSNNQSINQSLNQFVTKKQFVDRPLYITSLSNNQSINQSIPDCHQSFYPAVEECKESLDRSFDQSFDQSINQSVNLKKRSYELINQSLDQSVNQNDQTIKQLLPHIRFPLMSGSELSSIVQSINQSNFLSSTQLIDLFVYINSDRKASYPPIHQSVNQSINFLTRPRVACHQSLKLNYQFDGDEYGLIYWLGTHSINRSSNRSMNQTTNQLLNQSINPHPFINPAVTGEASIRASSVQYGSVNQLINRSINNFWTHQSIQPSTGQLINQSIILDIDPQSLGRSVNPSHLSIMHGFDRPLDSLINFTFEGLTAQSINQSTNQLIDQSAPNDQTINQSINQLIDQSTEWVTLLTRHNTRPCVKGYQYRTYEINHSTDQLINPSIDQAINQSINQSINQGYRYFRIRSIGVDSSDRTSFLCVGQIEIYGQLIYVDQTINQSNKRTNKQSKNQSIKQSNNQPDDESDHSDTLIDSDSDSELDPIDQPITPTNTQSTLPRNNQLNNQVTNQTNNQTINHPVNQPDPDRCLRPARDSCVIM